MKHWQIFSVRRAVTAMLIGMGFTAAQAQAAVDAAITTAIDTMKADAIVVASAVLVAIIAVMAVKFIRKGM